MTPTALSNSRPTGGFPASVPSATAGAKPHAGPRTDRACSISSWHFRFSFHPHGTAFQAKRLAVNQGVRHFAPGFLNDA